MRVPLLFSLIVVLACAASVLGQTQPSNSNGISIGDRPMPRVASKPEPETAVSSDDATCTIVLRAVFDKKGKVTHISFVEARPQQQNGCFEPEIKSLKKKSIDAARKIKFIPAMKDGQPVSMWMQLEYNFSPSVTKNKK